ncbi:GTP-binding protein, partial [Spiroplasma sp. K1]
MCYRKPHVNVGTIGHVDHGKTTLTAAITKVWYLCLYIVAKLGVLYVTLNTFCLTIVSEMF